LSTPLSPRFPYTTLFRSVAANLGDRPQRGRRLRAGQEVLALQFLTVARLELRTEVRQTLVPRADHAHLRRTGRRVECRQRVYVGDRKSTRLNSSHVAISY